MVILMALCGNVNGGAKLAGLTEREFTKILDWPGYRVYRHEIGEETRTLKLWVRRKSGNRVLTARTWKTPWGCVASRPRLGRWRAVWHRSGDGAGHRSTVSGALGEEPEEASATTDGRR